MCVCIYIYIYMYMHINNKYYKLITYDHMIYFIYGCYCRFNSLRFRKPQKQSVFVCLKHVAIVCFK